MLVMEQHQTCHLCMHEQDRLAGHTVAALLHMVNMQQYISGKVLVCIQSAVQVINRLHSRMLQLQDIQAHLAFSHHSAQVYSTHLSNMPDGTCGSCMLCTCKSGCATQQQASMLHTRKICR